MKAIKYSVLLILLWILCTVNVVASSTSVMDEADLLTTSEEQQLQEQIDQCKENKGVNTYILTIDDAQGMSASKYVDNYIATNKTQLLGGKKSAMLCVIDMDNRKITTMPLGNALEKYPVKKTDEMIDAIYDDLKADKFYEVCKGIIKKIDYKVWTIPEVIGISTLVAIVLGVIITAVRVFAATHKGSNLGVDYYIDSNNMVVKDRTDMFIRKTVDRRTIPKKSSGGSGGSSGGGSSSGGSSRSF